MQEKYPTAWTSVTHYLKTAALLPQQRDELISHALQQLLSCVPSTGTAVIWPCRNRKVPWKVYYAGIKRNTMHRWLSARLNASVDDTLAVLQHDLTGNLPDMPFPFIFHLHTAPSSPCGLWVVWTTLASPLTGDVVEWLERIRQTLDALLEVPLGI